MTGNALVARLRAVAASLGAGEVAELLRGAADQLGIMAAEVEQGRSWATNATVALGKLRKRHEGAVVKLRRSREEVARLRGAVRLYAPSPQVLREAIRGPQQ